MIFIEFDFANNIYLYHHIKGQLKKQIYKGNVHSHT